MAEGWLYVEVDGPSHFLLPDSRGEQAPNGSTLLKRRLLVRAGWRVLSVPYIEWNALGSNAEKRQYLKA